MLDAYSLEKHRLTSIPPERIPAALPNAIWIQLADPSPEELDAVQALYQFPFPNIEEIEQLEASAHHVVHDEAIQFNTLFLHTLDGIPHNTNACIIVCDRRVVCLSARELPAFRLLRMRSAHDPTLIEDHVSIAAVVFLPPTLVASIYGMNFDLMPELKWPWGYPLAILLMIGSAIAPYLYFKRKGWL